MKFLDNVVDPVLQDHSPSTEGCCCGFQSQDENEVLVHIAHRVAWYAQVVVAKELGWDTFGAHADEGLVPPLEFRGMGDDGEPLWERENPYAALAEGADE